LNSEKQFCGNHPNAPAIAACGKCGVSLCGVCARFADAGVYCEACENLQDSERFVENETRKLNQPAVQPIIPERDTVGASTPQKPGSSAQTRNIIIIAVCLCIMAVRVYFVIADQRQPVSPQFLAQEQQMLALLDCLSVFRQIGEELAANRQPGSELRCDPSGPPNIVVREGDTVKISHPNPESYGYSAIYVTNASTDPVLENL